ncbi:MAG: type IV secretion system DNA-binding domain-containing protein [Anaerolineaceae bacterium]|nr:type IV secretion system DNA-binding domain-containing protein [Anaerolineaceae bacterium]
MSDNKNHFYLGREFDASKGKLLDKKFLYDPSDLTTHAFVTGMTGSGKTGLCIGLLEEAAIQGFPAIIIDPKGDLTNLMLHFPDLLPEDFEPWINPDDARRAGVEPAEFAGEIANRWREGLSEWGLGRKDLFTLKEAAQFNIFTPGSTAGLPINILSSFQAPIIPWQENCEILRERISSTVTGLLGLIGLQDIDPLRSREHILLSNLLEQAWSQGNSLDLVELIEQTQNPPIKRLGAFSIDRFFPENDRFELAMLLNNFLASPSFQAWLKGQSLDIPDILYTKDGHPRHSIFYLAHLSENERMFFVTLLFAAFETWMRAQRGTSGLRALIYFDEITGYLPPVRNPPSRPIMLRMLKQARAFGVGLILATQNPSDLDYKALSNAGTWIIGRLQTERDKERLMDGLAGVGGIRDRQDFERLISGLEKRVFLMHNVHHTEPQVFHTRWVLNYLAGPLTRAQIPALNSLNDTIIIQADAVNKDSVQSGSVGVHIQEIQPQEQDSMLQYLSVHPSAPSGIREYFLPNDLGVTESSRAAGLQGQIQSEGILYRPALLAQVEVRYLSRRYNIEYDRHIASLVTELYDRLVPWDDYPWRVYEKDDFHRDPLPKARFSPIPDWLQDVREVKSMEKDYGEWIYREGTIHLHANETLKIYAGPQVSTGKFREMCSEAARVKWEAEERELLSSYDKKIETLLQKITRQELEVEEQEDEVGQRRMEEIGTHGELLLSLFSRRKRSVSSSLTKRRMTTQAKAKLEQEHEELEQLQKKLDGLQEEKDESIRDAKTRWAEAVNDISDIPLAPYKKDIFIQFFGIAWTPFYLIKEGHKVIEVPAVSSLE